jgi:hypothetical protein
MSGEDEVELSPEEAAALAALARERSPDAQLEDRTVEALRAAGLLHRPRRAWAIRVAALAAGLALFIGGFALGRRSAGVPDGGLATAGEGRSTVPQGNAAVVRQVVWF